MFCGGLIADIKRRAPYYKSDWTDAFASSEQRAKTLSSTAFLFFACLSAALSFGTLFGEFTEQQLGASETILACAISGIAYAFFAGQPLCILGATGGVPVACVPTRSASHVFVQPSTEKKNGFFVRP
jgi:hypothetical protein